MKKKKKENQEILEILHTRSGTRVEEKRKEKEEKEVRTKRGMTGGRKGETSVRMFYEGKRRDEKRDIGEECVVW